MYGRCRRVWGCDCWKEDSLRAVCTRCDLDGGCLVFVVRRWGGWTGDVERLEAREGEGVGRNGVWSGKLRGEEGAEKDGLKCVLVIA